MRVHAFSSYSAQAGSTRVRLHDWFRHVDVAPVSHTYIGQRDASASTLARNVAAVARAERHLRQIDVRGTIVLMSREASPLSSGPTERRLLQTAAHSVFDFDDALYDDPSRVRRLLGQRDKCRSSVAAADVVIAGNEHLAEWAAAVSSNVVVVPSCIEPDDYLPKRSWEVGETPIVVWLGSPSTEQFVAEIAIPLRAVHEMTGARLRLVSGPAANPALETLASMMDRIPWSPTAYAAALQGADVAIGPLGDTSFTRGKCAYKLLQYAATALPMVASPVGANVLALQRFDGVAATSLSDWREALTAMLLEHPSRRGERGRTALESARRHYSFSAWEQPWRSATGLMA